MAHSALRKLPAGTVSRIYRFDPAEMIASLRARCGAAWPGRASSPTALRTFDSPKPMLSDSRRLCCIGSGRVSSGLRSRATILRVAALAPFMCVAVANAGPPATTHSDQPPARQRLAREPFVIPLRQAQQSNDTKHQEQELTFGEPPVRVVRNIENPTLTAFLPEPSHSTGTAVIVAPGGAFIILAIAHEGEDVARWLSDRGIAAFVLRYRLAPTPRDDAQFRALRARQLQDPTLLTTVIKSQAPIAISDSRDAIALVRKRAAEWGIAADHIGIIGFSAGGAVATGSATSYDASNRPDFVASIYGGSADVNLSSDAPPAFIAATSDDPVVPASTSVQLYSKWRATGRPAELHIYVKGGHGFGMNHQGLPSDHWIDQFYCWLTAEGFVRPPDSWSYKRTAQ